MDRMERGGGGGGGGGNSIIVSTAATPSDNEQQRQQSTKHNNTTTPPPPTPTRTMSNRYNPGQEYQSQQQSQQRRTMPPQRALSQRMVAHMAAPFQARQAGGKRRATSSARRLYKERSANSRRNLLGMVSSRRVLGISTSGSSASSPSASPRQSGVSVGDAATATATATDERNENLHVNNHNHNTSSMDNTRNIPLGNAATVTATTSAEQSPVSVKDENFHDDKDDDDDDVDDDEHLEGDIRIGMALICCMCSAIIILVLAMYYGISNYKKANNNNMNGNDLSADDNTINSSNDYYDNNDYDTNFVNSLRLRTIKSILEPLSSLSSLDGSSIFDVEISSNDSNDSNDNDTESSLSLSSPQRKAFLWLIYKDPIAKTIPLTQIERFQARYALATFYYATNGEISWLDDLQFLSNRHECNWKSSSSSSSINTVLSGVSCNLDLQVTGITIAKYNGLHGTIPEEIKAFASTMKEFRIRSQYPSSEESELSSSSSSSSSWNGSISGIENLSSLTNLQVLDLSGNHIASTIPAFFFSSITKGEEESSSSFSRSLIELDLSNNLFYGSLPPPSLQSQDDNNDNMTNLKILRLQHNHLDGFLDRTIQSMTSTTTSSSLSLLEELDVSDNDDLKLNVNNVDWYPFENLKILNLQGVALFGTFPDPDDGSYLTNLEEINIGNFIIDHNNNNNHMTPFPTFLGQLTNLRSLIMEDNVFQSSIPDEFVSSLMKMTNLNILSLKRNGLTGTIPETIFNGNNNLGNLVHLDLSDNPQMQGTIPTFMFDYLSNSMETLSLRFMNLHGTIPSSIGNLMNLVHLDVSNNQLSGPIPTEMGTLKNLVFADLHDNQLTGTVDFLFCTNNDSSFSSSTTSTAETIFYLQENPGLESCSCCG